MEYSDFDSDESVHDHIYLSDDIPTTSMFLTKKEKGTEVKIERATLSPTSDSQSEINDGNENITKRVRGANSILFNRFFNILEKRENTMKLKGMGGIIAQCRICFKKVKGTLRVNSNFIRHLRIRHAKEYDEYEKNKKTELKENISTNFDKRILMFLAATFSSLNVVESPEFKNLFKGFPVKFKTKQKMANILEETHALWLLNTIIHLKEIPHLCTTADVWSLPHKSFFGYACHYIAPDTLERKHLALACRRLKKTYTYEKLAEIVNQIHREFEIDNNKIVLSITDNGYNARKTLKEFGISLTPRRDDSDSDDAMYETNNDLINSNLTLPHYFPCVSHTLNLLATVDLLKIIKSDEQIYFRHKQAFACCSNIWIKYHQPKTAEVVKNALSSELKTPLATEWNALYDCVKCLLNHKDKLFILCTELGVAKFSSLDIEYLERYARLMEPVANAIEFLQEQEHMYFGFFIAAIISLKVKLQRLLDSNSQGDLTAVYVDLLNALIQRFEVFFKGGEEANLVLLAGMTHPAVKLRFLPVLQQTAPHLTLDALKQMFVEQASIYSSVVEETIAPKSNADMGFLDFGEIDSPSKTFKNHGIRKELDMFLLDAETDLSSLNKYPLIKQMFLKFNTPLPSSAPVEQFFSFNGMVDIPRRNKLSDSNFEMLVLLKANNL